MGDGVNEHININNPNKPHNFLFNPIGSGSYNGGWSTLITKNIRIDQTSQFIKPYLGKICIFNSQESNSCTNPNKPIASIIMKNTLAIILCLLPKSA